MLWQEQNYLGEDLRTAREEVENGGLESYFYLDTQSVHGKASISTRIFLLSNCMIFIWFLFPGLNFQNYL